MRYKLRISGGGEIVFFFMNYENLIQNSEWKKSRLEHINLEF